MKTIEEKINIKATRRNVQKHLKFLGKKMFKTEIMDFLSYSSSVLSNPSTSGSNSSTSSSKILSAIEKSNTYNEDIQEYIENIMKGINRLESTQKQLILGKYLYQFDEEEFEDETKLSMRTIYNYLKEAEIDLAIILDCAVYNP